MLIPTALPIETPTMKRFPLIAGTGLFIACSGITEPVCGCSPFVPTAKITGTVRSPAMAPVAGAAVQVRLMKNEACEDTAQTLVETVSTDAAGRFQHWASFSGGRRCFRVWAEPPQGSALVRSDSQFIRVSFTATGATPDSVDLTFQLR
jgi:hypothetical protein